MKKFRNLACLFLALAMMFSLTACQSFEAKMTKAAAKMEKLQSYRMDLDMDMEMNLALLGESMDMNMSMKGTSDVNTEPMRMKMDMSIEMMGDEIKMLTYGEKDGDAYVTYVSPDGGSTWAKQSVDAGEMPGFADKNEFGMLFKLVQSFEKTGTETIRGSEAVVYSGVIEGEQIDEALEMSGVLESLYESMNLGIDADKIDFSAYGSIPTTIAFDSKSGMIVRYTMDMSEIMQNMLPAVMDEMMSSMISEAGLENFDLSTLGFKLEIGKVFVTAEFYDFDAVGTIEIPEAAKTAEEMQKAG